MLLWSQVRIQENENGASEDLLLRPQAASRVGDLDGKGLGTKAGV